MASSLFRNEPQNNSNGIFGRLQDAMQIIGNRDPEQAVKAFLRQRGVSDDQINDALKQAQNIVGNRGARHDSHK